MDGLYKLFGSVATPNATQMFARLFAAVLLIQLLLNFRDQLRYFATSPTKIYGQPQRLLGMFRLPQPNKRWFMALGGVLVLSLIFIVLGIAQRPFMIAALLSSLLYFNAISSLAYVQRKANLAILVLFILVFSPALGRPLESPGTGWELILVKICLAQMYLSSAVQKLKQSGFSWLDGETLQTYLIENYLWSDSRAALMLAQNKKLCAVLSVFTLLFELSFGLVIFFPQLGLYYFAAAVLFHTGTWITMRINYLKYLSPVLMVFLVNLAFELKDKLGR